MKQTNDPLLTCYGLDKTNNVTYISIQKENDFPTEFEIEKLLSHIAHRDMIFFISLQLSGKQEELMPAEILIKRKFNLFCKLVTMERTNTFSEKSLLCAVIVASNQLLDLVNVLITRSNNAFVVISDPADVEITTKEIFPCFKTGLLTPKVLAKCCSLTLTNHASFLHVLQGYDGYAVNLLTKE